MIKHSRSVESLVNSLKESYNKWHAKGNGKDIDPREIKYCHWILNLLGIESNKRLLDVSCGKGVFLQTAEKKDLKAYGIDISELAIERAKRNTKRAKIMVGDAEALPYKSNYFDYVTCLGSLEHFLHPDKGVTEIARVLRPEGRACIYLPNSYFIAHIYVALRYGIPPSEAEQDFSESFRTRVGWQRLLEENGLRVLKTYRYNTIWATKKVGKVSLLFYNFFIKHLIPFNLSYSFAYICQRT